MIRRRTLLSTAIAASAALGLAACSDDSSNSAASDAGGASDGGGNALDSVTFGTDLDAEPTVEFEAPLSITAPEAQEVVPGDGDALAEGDTIIWNSLFVDASSGEVLQSWWQGAPAGGVQVTSDAIGEQAFGFLTTAAVGARFAMAGWQQDASGTAVSLIQVSDILRKVEPLRAEGEEQEPSGDYPAVTLAEDGAPSLDSTPEGEAPTETVREVLIEGDGEDTTREGDYLTMHYTGWNWETGEQFDSSWDRGAPFSFVQGQQQVITGWDENLLDLPVGSQVMLVIPPAEAYGEEGESESELAGQTLLFVIDVLDAAHTQD